MTTSEQHEEELRKVIKKYRELGYKVIDLERKSPDAIVVRIVDGKIELNALEVLGEQYTLAKGWHKKWTFRAKQSIYHMFDNVIIEIFRRGKDYRKSKILQNKEI